MSARPPRQRPGNSSPVGRPVLQPNPQQIKVGDQVVAPSPAHSQTPEIPDSRTPEKTDSQSSVVPKYRTLVRKEARVRGDQADDLARLRRRLTAAREHPAERITDNTLIRVAVDLLLAHAEELHGNTEDELRNSVTPRLPE